MAEPKDPKIVLLCGGYEPGAQRLSEAIRAKGYLAFTLASTNKPGRIIRLIGEKVTNRKPDYIILDSLNGLWMQGVEIAREAARKANHDISIVVLSGNQEQVRDAQNAGLTAFNRNIEYLDKLYKFLGGNQQG